VLGYQRTRYKRAKHYMCITDKVFGWSFLRPVSTIIKNWARNKVRLNKHRFVVFK